jgi:hypothetical protein
MELEKKNRGFPSLPSSYFSTILQNEALFFNMLGKFTANI